MECWACGSELIWGGDNDDESEIYLIETNLSCSCCEAVVIVYHGKGENYEGECDEEQAGDFAVGVEPFGSSLHAPSRLVTPDSDNC